MPPHWFRDELNDERCLYFTAYCITVAAIATYSANQSRNLLQLPPSCSGLERLPAL
jgi:hypothetical protein